MKSGELRHYVNVQRNTAVQDDMGGYGPPVWTTQFSAFCSIEPVVGREWHATQVDRSGVTHKIKMRWGGSIDSTCRIVDSADGTIYEIVAIMNMDTRNREYQIQARTGVAANG